MKNDKEIFEFDIENMDEIFKQATKEAIKGLHDKGIPTVNGDGKDIYITYPDGRKEVISSEEG